MNREILFRGKCVSDSKYAGEWVTGGYVAPDADCKKRNEGLIVEYFGGNTTITYHVDPDTVGEFAGLVDKNGVKIFGGDWVLLEGVGIFNVRYSTSMCQFGLYGKRGFVDALKELQEDRYVVVGNVYDNPELLATK